MNRTQWWDVLNRFKKPQPINPTTPAALEELVRIQARRIAQLEEEVARWKREHDILMALL